MKHNKVMRSFVWIFIVLSMLSLAYALAGNNIVSQVRQFTINNAPIVTNLYPNNNTRWTTSYNVSFRYNVTDSGDTLVNCSLYLNTTWNASNQSAVVQNQNLTINVTLANGGYNWSIHCFDDGGMEGISQNWNLTVDYTVPVLSINITDATINFGTCVPNSTGTWFDSNDTSRNGTGAGLCTGMSDPQNITVENDGNQLANVTIMVNTTNLAGNAKSQLWYAIQNSTLRPGCLAGANQSWVNFTAAGTEYVACNTLNSTDTNDQFWTFIRAYVPSDSLVGSRTVSITYTAYASN